MPRRHERFIMSDPIKTTSSQASKRLTIHILIGMAAGVLLGITLNAIRGPGGLEGPGFLDVYVTDGALYFVGQVFLRLLQVIVIPLVLVSLIAGTAALEDISRVGRVGLKTLALYLITTAIAISLAMGAALLLRPGAGVPPPDAGSYVAKEAPPFVETLINIFPRNVFEAMANGQMLPIIVFAVFFGLAITLAGKPGQRVLSFIKELDTVVMKLVWIIMLLAPYGVFALVARTFATLGFDGIWILGKYFAVVLGVLILHAAITYPILLTTLARLSPLRFLKSVREVQLFAFSTASSNATIPVTLRTVEEKLGARNSIASFSVPLGATVNMDGTAIMQGVATIFIAQVYAIDLSTVDLLMVILTATMASIGTAGVPGVGLLMLSMILTQVGLPVDGIALIIGIDRLLDMVRTAVNVTGDCAVSCIVAKSEGEWDRAIFEQEDEA
jgi:Na+/H+-dicarboxylate symporter